MRRATRQGVASSKLLSGVAERHGSRLTVAFVRVLLAELARIALDPVHNGLLRTMNTELKRL